MIKKDVYVPESWSDVEEAYRNACSVSCKPSDKFRWPKVGEVLDEDKSVRWNREEVERLRTEYDEEVKRLNRAKNAAVQEVTERAIKLIAYEGDMTIPQARVVWAFLYEHYHAYCEMFSQVEEYLNFLSEFMNAGKV